MADDHVACGGFVMAVKACEDVDAVFAAIQRLRKEQADNLNCQCKRPDGGGAIDSSACPLHRPPIDEMYCGLRDPRDCWGRVLPNRVLP